MANSTAFARCQTVQDVENLFEVLTSPENISCDGERSITAQHTIYKTYVADAKARMKELAG